MKLHNITKELILEAVNRDKVIDAIEKKLVCTIFYEEPSNKNKVKPGYREIEPFVYGKGYVTSKTQVVLHPDREYVRAWVIRGTSKTGKKDPSVLPGWRLFRLDRTRSWVNTQQNFDGIRDNYNPDDKNINSIFYSVKIDEKDVPPEKQSWWSRIKNKMKSIFREEYLNEGFDLID